MKPRCTESSKAVRHTRCVDSSAVPAARHACKGPPNRALARPVDHQTGSSPSHIKVPQPLTPQCRPAPDVQQSFTDSVSCGTNDKHLHTQHVSSTAWQALPVPQQHDANPTIHGVPSPHPPRHCSAILYCGHACTPGALHMHQLTSNAPQTAFQLPQ